ncbi:MAG: DEAD/DEAH box helicase [Flavobacteriales bacterium]|nr:DEAD/DEAH box helicase [Flavobacteriales bacterium]
MTFKELGLDEFLIKSVEELGFETPSPIQEKSIPQLLVGDRDYVGLAQTGTGKTAAFGLPLLQHIDTEYRAIQGLILCPTRELCLQIAKELKSYSKYLKGINIVAVYGGANISEQIREIKKGANIIVGTPGRTIDLMERKVLKFDTVSRVILDEADEMLNMGFKDDINQILEDTPPFKRTWLFSATMPAEVERIAKNYMENPISVTVGTKNSTASNISHLYAMVSGRDQYQALRRFIDYSPDMFGIVFTRTRRDAKEFAEKLMTDGYNADALHGDLSQAQRDSVMNKFRNRALQVLIATDVAARGIDVDDVTHVFHIDLPDEIESYTHRSGRTARAGKSGKSIALVSPSKSSRIKLVEKQIGKKLELIKVPTGNEICGNQLIQLINNVKEVEINRRGIAPYLSQAYDELSLFSKEELIERFISTEFNRFLKTYEKAGDINVEPRGQKGKERDFDRNNRNNERGNNSGSSSNSRVFINIGKLDGFENKGQVLGFICNQSGIDGNSIGKIDLFDSFTFLNIDPEAGASLISSLNGKRVENRDIRVEFSKERSRSESRSENPRNNKFGRGAKQEGERRKGSGRFGNQSDRGSKPRHTNEKRMKR